MPEGWERSVIRMIAVAFSLFQLYTAAFGVFEQFFQRSIHLAFGLALLSLTYKLCLPRTSLPTRPRIWDWTFAGAGVLSSLFIIMDYERLMTRIAYVEPLTNLDWVASLVLILVVIEVCRRAVSGSLAVITIMFLVYALFGNLIPGSFGHPGLPIEEILETMYLSSQGIFGIPIGVSATYVFIFILFGGFTMRLGLMSLFADLAMAAAGSTAGGPAKVAVLCSALFGTVSGSGIANAITTGSFTVPLMKKVGYRAHFAAGVESAASMGGNLMPPIMGAAAFIMADFLGVPYRDIVMAAIIPALLYFFGLGTMVHLEALKQGMTSLPREGLPRAWPILRSRGHLLMPIFALVYFVMSGRSVMFSGIVGIGITILVGLVRKETRITPRKFVEILEWGALTALPVIAACAVVGIIIGVVAQTGFGVKMTSAILAISGDSMLLTLVFAMVASLVLGLGLPTTPTYIITAALCAPALVAFGLPAIAAHFFVFYYGILADITPPTAIAPYALSSIAGSDPNRTCLAACMVALSGFIVPFLIAYEPAMLDPLLQNVDTTLLRVVTVTGSAAVGIVMLSGALIGYLRTRATALERLALLAGACTLIFPGLATDLMGVVAIVVVLSIQTVRMRRKRDATGAEV